MIVVFTVICFSEAWAQEHDHEGLPSGDTAGDRLMTDEVKSVESSIVKITASATKGDLDGIKMALRMVERNWVAIRTELQRRGDNISISNFEAASQSIAKALETEGKTGAIREARRLSAAFTEVKKSLGKVEVDVPRFVVTLSYFTLAWFSLTLAVTEVMTRGKVKL